MLHIASAYACKEPPGLPGSELWCCLFNLALRKFVFVLAAFFPAAMLHVASLAEQLRASRRPDL